MYESHFGFDEKPFSLLPDPSFLYLGQQHGNSLAMLEYGLTNQAGISVLSGDIGSGKTTLIRHILDTATADLTVGVISNTHPSFGELLQWVLLALGLEYRGKEKVELFQIFTEFLIDEYAAGRRTVLIIDEAQNMEVDTLEELRMLSNVNADKDQVLQLILVGQPELREKLRRPELIQFAQRIAVDYHLEPLVQSEVRSYIDHRVRTAGGDPTVFESGCEEEIYAITNGVPRLINVLCDTALAYAFGSRLPTVSADIIAEVHKDKTEVEAKVPISSPSNGPRPMPLTHGSERSGAVKFELDADIARQLFSGLRDSKG